MSGPIVIMEIVLVETEGITICVLIDLQALSVTKVYTDHALFSLSEVLFRGEVFKEASPLKDFFGKGDIDHRMTKQNLLVIQSPFGSLDANYCTIYV